LTKTFLNASNPIKLLKILELLHFNTYCDVFLREYGRFFMTEDGDSSAGKTSILTLIKSTITYWWTTDEKIS